MNHTLVVAAITMGAIASAMSAALVFAGPDLGAALGPAALALLLTLVGGVVGHRLGGWTLRDAYREWALSRDGSLWTIAILTVIALIIHAPAGIALGVALVAGHLSARDPPRASDVAFLAVGLEVVAGVATHARAWQDSPLFAVPIVLLCLAFAAREAWDIAHLSAASDRDSVAAAGRAFAAFATVVFVSGLFAAAVGWWLHAGGDVSWAPGVGSRGGLLALVVGGAAGAAWLLARRRTSGS